jgi:hypothetical protein
VHVTRIQWFQDAIFFFSHFSFVGGLLVKRRMLLLISDLLLPRASRSRSRHAENDESLSHLPTLALQFCQH